MIAETAPGHGPENGFDMRSFVDSNNRFFVRHNGEATYEPARDYLLRAGAPIDLIDRLFTEDGRFRYTNTFDPYAHSADATDRQITTINTPVARVTDFSLDASTPFGFNDHGRRHLGKVKEVGRPLLVAAKATEDELRNGLIAMELHDDGNFLSRKYHAELSQIVAAIMLPNLARPLDPINANHWETIREAIRLHDPDNAYRLVRKWGPINAEERVVHIRDKFSKEALVLFIADKTQIGSSRIRATTPEAVEDEHIVLNLLAETTRVGLSEDGKTFEWKLALRPQVEETMQESPFARYRSRFEGKSLRVSERMHAKHREAVPSPHTNSWQEIFWTFGFDRNIFVVQAAFALFPEVERVVISMNDSPVPEDPDLGHTSTEVFRQQFLDQHIKQLIVKHVPKEKRDAMSKKLLNV